MSRRLEVVVIGAGQSGLAVAYHLQKAKRDFVILDAAPAVGHSWRTRYDSMRLFTPVALNDLPGFAFPRSGPEFPSKGEMADYLSAYANRVGLPVELNTRVTALRHALGGYELETTAGHFVALQVVVATGAFQHPRLPAFSALLSREIFQVHSSRYRNPAQLPAGEDALVVGSANSGAQIALELAGRRRTYLAAGRMPVYSSPQWLLDTTWAWRVHKARATFVKRRLDLPWPFGTTQGFFVGDFHRKSRERGILGMPRVVDGAGDEVRFEGGATLRPSAVVWATGYETDYSWIDLRICDENGRPKLARQAMAAPGLFFIGLWNQRSLASALIFGARSDSAHVASLIAQEKTSL
jgi:putative flavoprotein involved in K+ transport